MVKRADPAVGHIPAFVFSLAAMFIAACSDSPRSEAGSGPTTEGEGGSRAQWSQAEAAAWYDALPWLVGCNFVPSTGQRLRF